MAYTPNPTWVDGQAGGTPITAAALQHIEDGIAAAAQSADDATTALAGKASSSHTHTATGISDSTTVGRSVLTASTATAATKLESMPPERPMSTSLNPVFAR